MVFQRIWRQHRKVFFVAMLFLTPLLPLLLMRVELPRLNLYYRVSSNVVHPTARVMGWAAGGVDVIWSRYINLVNTTRQNETLVTENAQLKEQILELSEARDENERLKKVLNIPQRAKWQGIGAIIVGQDSSAESQAFVINVGEKDGIERRMAVINTNGVVGTITKVFPSSSIFTALQDPSHNVDGVIVRSRARFIVEGAGRALTGQLKYLDRAEDVRVGDQVITSGLDGVFPKGLLVGHLIRVSRPRAGVTQEAEMRPAVDLGHLEEVVVLTRRPSAEAQAAESAEAAHEGNTAL